MEVTDMRRTRNRAGSWRPILDQILTRRKDDWGVGAPTVSQRRGRVGRDAPTFAVDRSAKVILQARL
jgi:hypothetical protein